MAIRRCHRVKILSGLWLALVLGSVLWMVVYPGQEALGNELMDVEWKLEPVDLSLPGATRTFSWNSPSLSYNKNLSVPLIGSELQALCDTVNEVLDAVDEILPDCLSPPKLAPIDLSFGASASAGFNFTAGINTLSARSDSGPRVDGSVGVELRPSKPCVARGEELVLQPVAYWSSVTATLPAVTIEAPTVKLWGHAVATLQLKPPLVGQREVGVNEGFDYSFGEGVTKEFEGTSISVTAQGSTIPGASKTFSDAAAAGSVSVSAQGTPILTLTSDLDELFLILVAKGCARKAADAKSRGDTASQEKWDTMAHSAGQLKGLRLDLRYERYGAGITASLELLDAKFNLVLTPEQELVVSPLEVDWIEYDTTRPMVFNGQCKQYATYGPVNSDYSYMDASIRVPQDSEAERIVIYSRATAHAWATHTVRLHAKLTIDPLSVGKLGVEFGEFNLFQGWIACGKVPTDICWALFVPYPCEWRELRLPSVGFGPWTLNKTLYKEAVTLCDEPIAEVSYFHPIRLNTPAFDLPPTTILVACEESTERLCGPRFVGIRSAEAIQRSSCTFRFLSSSMKESLVLPGSTAIVRFGDAPGGIVPEAVTINRQEADLVDLGGGWWEASVVLEPWDVAEAQLGCSTGQCGFIQFDISYRSCRSYGGSARLAPVSHVHVTSDDSYLIYVDPTNFPSPPTAPLLRAPDDCSNRVDPELGRWGSGADFEWHPAFVATELSESELEFWGYGSLVVAYEFNATLVRADGTTREIVELIGSRSCSAPETHHSLWLLPDSVIRWSVRAQDVFGRWGPPSETRVCWCAPPVSIESSYMTSSNRVNSSLARPGDTVTLAFTTDAVLHDPPSVWIGELAADVTGSGATWTATRMLSEIDFTGSVDFRIECPASIGTESPWPESQCAISGPTSRKFGRGEVAFLGAPEAPTLLSPADGSEKRGGASLRWVVRGLAPHWSLSPLEYELELAVQPPSGPSWSEVIEATTNHHALSFEDLGIVGGSEVTWRVRALDALNEWSDYSASRTFSIAAAVADLLQVTVEVADFQPDPVTAEAEGTTWVFFVVHLSGATDTWEDIPDAPYWDPCALTEEDITLGGTADASIDLYGEEGPRVHILSDGSLELPVRVTGAGTVAVSFKSGGICTKWGVRNQPSNQATATVVPPVPLPPLTVSIGGFIGSNEVWVDFSDAVEGFDSEDVSFSGTALPTACTILENPWGGHYLIEITGMTQTGSVTCWIEEGRVTSKAWGVPNTQSNVYEGQYIPDP